MENRDNNTCVNFVPFMYKLSDIKMSLSENLSKCEELQSNLDDYLNLSCKVSSYEDKATKLNVISSVKIQAIHDNCTTFIHESEYILNQVYIKGEMHNLIAKSILAELIYQHLSRIPSLIHPGGMYKVPNLCKVLEFISNKRENIFDT